MSFPWLDSTRRPDGAGVARRDEVAAAELASRAALLYRLGFTAADATRRLVERVAWEYEPASRYNAFGRPKALSDQAIAKIVGDTYARRP